MNEITIGQNNLPVTLDDLSKFVLVNEERLTAVQAELRAMKKLKLASAVVEQKKEEAQELNKILLYAQMRLGEITAAIPTRSGARTDITSYPAGTRLETKQEALESIGIRKKAASMLRNWSKAGRL